MLFWAVLVISAGFTLTRLPGMATSRNQAVFACGVCMCTGLALMIPPIYETVDSTFARTNFTDLFAKLALFLAVSILGTETAKALQSRQAYKAIGGFQGRLVLVAAYILEMALFAFTDTPQPSPGLEADKTDPLVIAYTAVAVLYVAYVSFTLIAPLYNHYRNGHHGLNRSASALLLIGFVLVVIRAVLIFVGITYPQIYSIAQGISLSATLLVVAGLATAWLSLHRHGEPAIKQSLLRDEV